MKEEELARVVIDWLKHQEWEVYQEVETFRGVCDIVAVRGPCLWAIECKVTFSLSVLEQAWNWNRCANLISVAVPRPKIRRGVFGAKIAGDHGIGVIHVSERKNKWEPDPFSVSYVPGNFTSKIVPSIIKEKLNEAQKDWAPAGNSCGKRWTPFGETKRRLIALVEKDGPLPMKRVMDELKHHYASDASAKRSLVHLIDKGVISELVIVRDKRKVTVQLASHK